MYWEDYYLAHTGRKGMKWGQHIFGKKYTRWRKRRQAKVAANREERLREVAAQRTARAKAQAAKSQLRTIKSISDADLKKMIDRLTMEKTYKQLVAELNPQKTSRIKALKDEFLNQAQKKAASVAVNMIANKLMGTTPEKKKRS